MDKEECLANIILIAAKEHTEGIAPHRRVFRINYITTFVIYDTTLHIGGALGHIYTEGKCTLIHDYKEGLDILASLIKEQSND